MTRLSPLRLAFLVALLCAMSLRLLTPPGWMPNVAGRGSAPLVICTGDGVRLMTPADRDGHGHRGKPDHEVCAFAGFALGAAQPAAALAAPAHLPGAAAPTRPFDQGALAPTWRRPQAPRAPPVLF